MHVPLCDLKAQYAAIRDEIDRAVEGVFASTQFIGGPEIRAFEEEFARYSRAGAAVAVANGTTALHLAYLAAGVGPGDEVVTVSHTFIATIEPLHTLGARARFVDIDPDTYGLDPAKLDDAITEKTRAVVPVHLYGHPVDFDPIHEIAEARGVAVIEDAAQAHGASYKDRICGSLAPIATFSFYPGKNLGACGDAGALTFADAELADRTRRLANHGRAQKYLHDEVGFNYRMDALQAAILRVKLAHLSDWTEGRRRVARAYHERLTSLEHVDVPQVADWADPVWHLFVVRVPHRDEVLAALRKDGIDAGIHYPVPLHLQPAYRHLGYTEGSLPVTERVAGEILSLPIFPEMTESQIDYVVEALTRAVG